MTLLDFEIFRPLGRGAFGAVCGARMRSTGHLFAIKSMNRKLIKGKNALSVAKLERKSLSAVADRPCPFVTSLRYAFVDNENFHFVIPLYTGGDLDNAIKTGGRFSEGRAKFTIAQVVLGIGHIHNCKLIYRDLKPENVSAPTIAATFGTIIRCEFR